MAIKTVAVVGVSRQATTSITHELLMVHSCSKLTPSQASGNIGAPITKALLAAGFKVTAVTRESSNSTFPANVDVRKADLTSVESVAKALSDVARGL